MIEDLAALVAAFAGVVGLGIAILTIRAQTRLSREAKTVDIFLSCLSSFDALAADRLAAELANDRPAEDRERLTRHFWSRYWALLVREYEFARSGWLPQPLFERWFLAAHAQVADDEEARANWEQAGRRQNWSISADFCTLVDRTLPLTDEPSVLAELREHFKAHFGRGVLGIVG